MTVLRRFRAPIIGVVALIFSATIALAAAPSSPGAAGLANAASHAGKTVPVSAGDQQVEETTTETESSTSETESSTSETESANHCNVDLTQDPSALALLNHGSVVCTAAQQDPPDGYSPDGYRNHGAWVSYWAKLGHASNNAGAGKNHQPGS